VTRMANETNEMSLDRNLVKNQQRINELEKQLELKESTISNLKKVIEQKDELWIATNDKVLDLEQKKTDIEEALVNLTIDEPGMDYFFPNYSSRFQNPKLFDPIGILIVSMCMSSINSSSKFEKIIFHK
jgi:hypothetical protein